VFALGLAVEYHFDTGIEAHNLDDCQELEDVNRLKRTLPSAFEA